MTATPMDFMTAEEAKAQSLANREGILRNIHIDARNYLQNQILLKRDHGVTKVILSGSADSLGGTLLYLIDSDTGKLLQVTNEVLQEFRELRYDVKVTYFELGIGMPPKQDGRGSYDIQLLISWD